MTDYLALVKEKEEEFTELDKRMQADSDLLYLKKFVLTDTKNKAVPDIINITLNKPAVFAANVLAALGNTNQQIIVESSAKKVDTYEIEEFQKAAFNMANARLEKIPGQALLNPFADIQFCFRGRTARRVLFRMEDGVLIPDITPWDGRYVLYEAGLGGLLWAAYKTYRSKTRLEKEYGITIKGKEGKVLDIWDAEHNEVWVDEKQVLNQKHDYGFTPVAIQVVPLGYGSSLLDGIASAEYGGSSFQTSRIAHEGESIFFLIRGLIPEFNRLASILQTLNMKAVKPPMKQKRKGGGEASEYDDVTDMATITAMEPDEDVLPIDYGDAKKSAEMLYNVVEKALQEGSITSIDLGNLQFPLSAVALVEISEGRDQVFLPRLQAKALLNKATAEMFTSQVLQIGGTVELGTPGHKRKFSTKKLQGEYETTYKYIVKSPKLDIARMSIATQAERYYSQETILKDVLQVEDYEGEMQRKFYDLAAQIDPLVLKHRVIMNMLKLAEDGDENAGVEAMIMAASMGMELSQILAGQLPPKTMQPETEKAEPLVPLLGEGGQVGGIPSSAVSETSRKATV